MPFQLNRANGKGKIVPADAGHAEPREYPQIVGTALVAEEPDLFLAIARIVKPQGRRGEVAAEILTDFPARFDQLCRAFLEHPGQRPDPVVVEKVWLHKGRVILKFSGVDSIPDANRLRRLHILIPREEANPLPDHHYYIGQLIGCQVVRECEGRLGLVGTVSEVERTGGVDLLHVAPQGGRRGKVLVPLAQSICTRIDPESKLIVIDPPQGLLELNELPAESERRVHLVSKPRGRLGAFKHKRQTAKVFI